MDARILTRLRTSIVGRYTIEREIGRGGMATVHVARGIKHDRSVALKVLKPELGVMLRVERFLSAIPRHGKPAASEPAPVFDSDDADGLLCYGMPYVAGGSLRAKLVRERQLPIDEAIRIATGVASALDRDRPADAQGPQVQKVADERAP